MKLVGYELAPFSHWSSQMENTTLKLRGMSCASCASSIEDAINSVPGVDECIVNFGSEQATVK